tara:strand:+ start:4166 stop:4738 length:573 start_codon:yes stop_codon:yes gene_type:complete
MSNIFALHECPRVSAKALADRHIIKMPVETVQMLVSALLISDVPSRMMPLTKAGESHKGGYAHHPATTWTAECFENWWWLLKHGLALCKEYTARYGKVHFAEGQLHTLRIYNINHSVDKHIPRIGEMTPFERCFNQSVGRNIDLLDTHNWPCEHAAYQEFYKREKSALLYTRSVYESMRDCFTDLLKTTY